MTSTEIRQSFLDFFKSKGHTIVPSSSLLPDSPNLLFTNAGMNQFVPIFLGQRAPDVSKWPGAIPPSPISHLPSSTGDTRAADTQKCIRAGGKHNDLEDVGLDTYHHTFFEMLGNWSFGDYFKKEAIEWAWELVVGRWSFPAKRLYATVYKPGRGDPSELDQEAYDHWARIFTAAGLDPKIHIVYGNKKDNFWMMGDTGPCGPCSEIHVDLTPEGDTKGSLVNKGDARCIEIWNLVFIQFNANPEGSFSPLPAKHVDTGMGFERVTGIIQNTKNFTDFSRVISNYETDIFRPLFDRLEKLSGKKYASTLPPADLSTINPQQSTDVAFRVIADHIRTLSFAIADGIQPGNTDRNYVLRRILRRAVRYGRTLGFHEPFFYKLVNVLAETMGHVFPEIRAKQGHVEEVIQREEEAFNKTLDNGIALFERRLKAQPELGAVLQRLQEASFFRDTSEDIKGLPDAYEAAQPILQRMNRRFKRALFGQKLDGVFMELMQLAGESLTPQEMAVLEGMGSLWGNVKGLAEGEGNAGDFNRFAAGAEKRLLQLQRTVIDARLDLNPNTIPGGFAFRLYDEQGFPLDLTELMARERGFTVNVDGFNQLMDQQKARARAAQKKTVVSLEEGADLVSPTEFVGFEKTGASSRVLKTLKQEKCWAVVLLQSPFYAEMGGQVGDTGTISAGASLWPVVDTKKVHQTWLHIIDGDSPPDVGAHVNAEVDVARRNAIQRHHTVTHLLHWALHEVVSQDAVQKGSYVGPEKLTFDFSSSALKPEDVAKVEELVNQKILENEPVFYVPDVPYAEVRKNAKVMQFFGEKYGEKVRVVQIGGHKGQLDGYSMELCGGTHTRATGEIGLFRIVAESAIAAGIRRIEAVSGLEAYKQANEQLQLIKTLSGKVNSPVGELEKKIESLLAQQKELERQLRAAQQKQAAETARSLVSKAQTIGSTRVILENLGPADGDLLQSIADSLKGQFKGVVVLGGAANGAVALVATVSPELTKQFQAGKIVQTIAPIVGGKGGGRPDNARGGGKEVAKLDEALAKAKALLAGP
jgi:alanyl-tRNA synthetase